MDDIAAHAATLARLEHLQALATALASAITTEEVLDALVAEMGDLVGAHMVVVGLVDEGGSTLRIVRSAGLPPEALQRYPSVPLGTGYAFASAVETNQPLWMRTKEEAMERSPILRAMQPLKSEAYASVPLAVPGSVIGAVGLSFPQEQTFDEPMRNFIHSVARQSAQAIERARLFDSEHRARQ